MVSKILQNMYAVERLMAYVVGLVAYTGFVALMGVMVLRHIAVQNLGNSSVQMLVKLTFPAQNQQPVNRSLFEQGLRKRLESLHEVEKYTFIPCEKVDVILAPHSFVDPIFVSVQVRANTLSVQKMERLLQKVHPSVQVQPVVSKKAGESRVPELICFALLLLVFFVSIIIVAFASQVGLAVNRKAVSTMALMGATPLYIIRQFQRHTLRLGGQGALFGMSAMLVTFAVLYYLPIRGGVHFCSVCSVPVVIGCCLGIPLFVMMLMFVATDLSIRKYLRYSVDSVDEWSV